VYYVTTLLGGNVSLTEKGNNNTTNIAHEVSFQAAPKKNIATYKVCFEQGIPPKAIQKPKIFNSSEKRIHPLAQPIFLNTGYGFALFSRPPPSVLA
jgi:hypothetical protein